MSYQPPPTTRLDTKALPIHLASAVANLRGAASDLPEMVRQLHSKLIGEPPRRDLSPVQGEPNREPSIGDEILIVQDQVQETRNLLELLTKAVTRG